MKKFFTGVKNWFIRHKPTKRRLIQLYAALLYNANLKGFANGRIYAGNTKYACLPGFNCYSCPGAVGACPLGALQNALASSNTRAPFYVFGILILFGLLLGRTICGFLCPVGLIQELLYKIKSPKLKKSRITRILSYFKYVLLAAMVIMIPLAYASVNSTLPAFCKYICPVGTLEGSVALLWNPTNSAYYDMLGPLFTWKFCVMILIFGGSIFVYRLFCRFICPLGAIYSLFCKVAMLGVKLDKQKCVDCGLCIQTCKMDIKHVGDHECIHCGDCLKVCPTQAISWKGSKIFLHANAIEPAGESASGETVALADILNGGTVTAANISAENAYQAQIAVDGAKNEADELAVAKMEKQREKALKKAEKKAKRSTPAYVKKRNIILQAIAWVAALAVLATALVYYNFIYEPVEASVVYAVGDTFEDFSLKKFFSEDDDADYTLSDDLNDGKVVILNFWYMGCQPCQQEIPYFLELAADENYKDKVSLVIIDAGDANPDAEKAGTGLAELEWYITATTQTEGRMTWGDIYQSATWCMDSGDEESVFLKAGGTDIYPVTVILDSDGVIQYQKIGPVKEATLYSEVDKILEN